MPSKLPSGGRYYEMNQYGANLLREAVNYGYEQGFKAGRAYPVARWGPLVTSMKNRRNLILNSRGADREASAFENREVTKSCL
jgi:hypothetical protein